MDDDLFSEPRDEQETTIRTILEHVVVVGNSSRPTAADSWSVLAFTSAYTFVGPRAGMKSPFQTSTWHPLDDGLPVSQSVSVLGSKEPPTSENRNKQSIGRQ